MFIAMNRFKITLGKETEFEEIWRSRDSYLQDVPGYREFHLVRGPRQTDHTLYATHVVWRDRESFEAWTRSEAFRLAHANAGANRHLYLGPPHFEGFDVVLAQSHNNAE